MGIDIGGGVFVSEPVPPLPAGVPGAAGLAPLLASDPQDAVPAQSTSAKREQVVNELRA
jgi:hypothetical protein